MVAVISTGYLISGSGLREGLSGFTIMQCEDKMSLGTKSLLGQSTQSSCESTLRLLNILFHVSFAFWSHVHGIASCAILTGELSKKDVATEARWRVRQRSPCCV